MRFFLSSILLGRQRTARYRAGLGALKEFAGHTDHPVPVQDQVCAHTGNHADAAPGVQRVPLVGGQQQNGAPIVEIAPALVAARVKEQEQARERGSDEKEANGYMERNKAKDEGVIAEFPPYIFLANIYDHGITIGKDQ